MNLKPRLTKVGLAAGGIAAGVVLATTLGAQAATSTPTPSTTSPSVTSTVAPDANPGDNGADGIPEAQEQHGGGHGGGRGGSLDLSGTVTAVGQSTVTIKTSTGTKAYTVTSSSDIDKNGEAVLKDLVVGDAVTFSVDSTATTTIDKLHTGDEAKNMPTRTPDATSSTTTSGA